MCDFLAETTPVARKDHRCGLCAYLIPKGTKHIARKSVDDGSAFTFRMHFACESATAHWDDEDWEHVEWWQFRILPEFVNHPDHPAIVSAGEEARRDR